jgi:hypothetical protein
MSSTRNNISSNTNVKAQLPISDKKVKEWQKTRNAFATEAAKLRKEIDELALVKVKPREAYKLTLVSLSPSETNETLIGVNNNLNSLIDQRDNRPKDLRNRRNLDKELVSKRGAKEKKLVKVMQDLAKYDQKLAEVTPAEDSSEQSADKSSIEEKYQQLKQEKAEAFNMVGKVFERKLSFDRLDIELEELEKPENDLRSVDELLLEDYKKQDYQKLVNIEADLIAQIESLKHDQNKLGNVNEAIEGAQHHLAILRAAMWDKRPGIVGTRTLHYLFRQAQF